MQTIELTPEVLRALAVGIDRLNDGDLHDRKVRLEAEKALARAGYIASHGACFPASEATHGYVNGKEAYMGYDTEWNLPVKPGDVLTLDEEGTTPLRTF